MIAQPESIVADSQSSTMEETYLGFKPVNRVQIQKEVISDLLFPMYM